MSVKQLLIAVVVLSISTSASGQAAVQSHTPDVVADINGKPITAAEIDAPLAASLAKLAEQIYRLRRAELDRVIGERLLAREAERRGITTAALTEAEITSRIQPVTTADAQAFFDANKSNLQGREFVSLQGQITAYLTAQRTTARRQELMKSLREGAKVSVFLTPPPPFRAEVNLADAPSRGKVDAPVTIVEFSDFQCPYCRRSEPVVQQVLARYGDKVRLVYKDMPLDNLHANARAAAEAAQCAAAQGSFWEYHDKLLAVTDLSAEGLGRIAGELGLDMKAFDACRTSRQFKARVEASTQEGSRLGVTGTPTFFINGRNLTGAQPLEAFVGIIEEELKKPAAPGTAAKH